jgi:hypothetical protein
MKHKDKNTQMPDVCSCAQKPTVLLELVSFMSGRCLLCATSDITGSARCPRIHAVYPH